MNDTSGAGNLQRELGPGEKLLWSGRPRAGIRLREADAFLIPGSILWCGFFIFLEVAMILKDAPVYVILWAIPINVVVFYVVLGRFILDARARAKTFYGITNERIIIIKGRFSREVKSLSLRTLADVSLSERGDGSGSIAFGPLHPMGYWARGSRYDPPAFDMIEQARSVYEIIRQAQASTDWRPAPRSYSEG